jgi:hypothetical protein
VLTTGAVGVFPGGPQTCASLELAVLNDAAYSDQVGEFVAFRTAIVERFREAGCLNEQAARETVQDELSTRGIQGWTVVAETKLSAARPCASLAFEPESLTAAGAGDEGGDVVPRSDARRRWRRLKRRPRRTEAAPVSLPSSSASQPPASRRVTRRAVTPENRPFGNERGLTIPDA